MLSAVSAYIKCSGNASLPQRFMLSEFSPLISLKSLSRLGGREAVLWVGLFGPGQEPSKPPLAWQLEKVHHGRGEFDQS